MIQYVKDYSFYLILTHLIDEYVNDIITDEFDFIVGDIEKYNSPESNYIDYSFIDLMNHFINYENLKEKNFTDYSLLPSQNLNIIDYNLLNPDNKYEDYSESIKPNYVVI